MMKMNTGVISEFNTFIHFNTISSHSKSHLIPITALLFISFVKCMFITQSTSHLDYTSHFFSTFWLAHLHTYTHTHKHTHTGHVGVEWSKLNGRIKVSEK